MNETNKEVRIAVFEAFEACLEAQLRAIRNLKMKARKPEDVKRTSYVDLVYEMLKSKNEPMYINKIIKNIYQMCNKEVTRDSLVSALTKKAKQGVDFIKVGPNTFSLREFGKERNNSYIEYYKKITTNQRGKKIK